MRDEAMNGNDHGTPTNVGRQPDDLDDDLDDETDAPSAPKPKQLTPKELLTILLEDMEEPTSPRDAPVSRERLKIWVTLVATALAKLDGDGAKP
jgi:hypothetical protein